MEANNMDPYQTAPKGAVKNMDPYQTAPKGAV